MSEPPKKYVWELQYWCYAIYNALSNDKHAWSCNFVHLTPSKSWKYKYITRDFKFRERQRPIAVVEPELAHGIWQRKVACKIVSDK